IARNAVLETYKTTPQKIESDLGKVVSVGMVVKGKKRTKKTVSLSNSSRIGGAPRAALIINKALGRKGEKGLNGAKMRAAMVKLIGARKRSINYVRASWIFGQRVLDKFVKSKAGAPSTTGIKPIGNRRGGAIPAMPAPTTKGSVFMWLNKFTAFAEKITTVGLTKAFQKEIRSMQDYMYRKFKETGFYK